MEQVEDTESAGESQLERGASPPYPYKSKELLTAQLSEMVIAPAEEKAKELVRK